MVLHCNSFHLTWQAFASVLIMFLINWGYALANISVALLVYIYIGQANPGLSKGEDVTWYLMQHTELINKTLGGMG